MSPWEMPPPEAGLKGHLYRKKALDERFIAATGYRIGR